jgi:hypothetical protein
MNFHTPPFHVCVCISDCVGGSITSMFQYGGWVHYLGCHHRLSRTRVVHFTPNGWRAHKRRATVPTTSSLSLSSGLPSSSKSLLKPSKDDDLDFDATVKEWANELPEPASLEIDYNSDDDNNDTNSHSRHDAFEYYCAKYEKEFQMLESFDESITVAEQERKVEDSGQSSITTTKQQPILLRVPGHRRKDDDRSSEMKLQKRRSRLLSWLPNVKEWHTTLPSRSYSMMLWAPGLAHVTLMTLNGDGAEIPLCGRYPNLTKLIIGPGIVPIFDNWSSPNLTDLCIRSSTHHSLFRIASTFTRLTCELNYIGPVGPMTFMSRCSKLQHLTLTALLSRETSHGFIRPAFDARDPDMVVLQLTQLPASKLINLTHLQLLLGKTTLDDPQIFERFKQLSCLQYLMIDTTGNVDIESLQDFIYQHMSESSSLLTVDLSNCSCEYIPVEYRILHHRPFNVFFIHPPHHVHPPRENGDGEVIYFN